VPLRPLVVTVEDEDETAAENGSNNEGTDESLLLLLGATVVEFNVVFNGMVTVDGDVVSGVRGVVDFAAVSTVAIVAGPVFYSAV